MMGAQRSNPVGLSSHLTQTEARTRFNSVQHQRLKAQMLGHNTSMGIQAIAPGQAWQGGILL